MKGVAGGHAAQRKNVQLPGFAAKLDRGFIPVRLRFLAPLVALRHEDFRSLQAQFALALEHSGGGAIRKRRARGARRAFA